jgi:hypothetical protein
MMSASFKDFALWQAAMHELHAHGSSKPHETLVENAKGTNIFLNTQIQQQEHQQEPPTKRHKPMYDVCQFNTAIAIATAKKKQPECSNNNVSPTGILPTTTTTVQNEIGLHQDMMKVMEGYIERKRLRKEVRNLMASQSPSVSFTQQELSQQQQQQHYHHQPNYESEELTLTVKKKSSSNSTDDDIMRVCKPTIC